MNENIDLTKILDGCPMWTKFYSTIHNEISFKRIELSKDYPIIFDSDAIGGEVILTEKGMALRGVGECIVFPSKDQRDWSKFVRFWDKKSLDKPVTEKFDPKVLQPFDKVLARSRTCDCWNAVIFSHMDFKHKAVCCEFSWEQCIPYNEETKDLVGTNEDCPEHYIWWEE